MSASTGGGGGALVRQGHLRKLKTMKKKFFVLRAESADCGPRLEYYESEKKWRCGAVPRRVLPLDTCYNITRRLDLKQKHVIALFTRDEQFCVVAENEQEVHAWLVSLLKLQHPNDASEELLHPIQHVWQVNVQKKGLGVVKNIHGLYNLCLTDKTLLLVKIKSHNNVISELGIPERIEYALKNIRRCGDSECFFYMEVGRQTTTGAGELWMHSDDTTIAQSMHSTILHAMRNCSKESENERDHIVIPKGESGVPARRSTYSDGRGRAGLTNATSEYQPTNTVTEGRGACHQRTVSLGSACSGSGAGSGSPLRVVHERTRSAPLTGEEVDTALGRQSHGAQPQPATRRASTGMRLSKLSPAHSKNASTLRNRCDSMPSQACSSFERERPTPRLNDVEGVETSRDEADAVSEWYRTPRIPEEPDVCDVNKDIVNKCIRGGGGGGSYQHSRTSSLGVEECEADAYLAMAPHDTHDGYLPMAPLDPLGSLVSASSGSVCSGTPSTDPRFSEYQLEPATMHIGCETRPPRAYSVGSRPAPRAEARHRAYSVGARARPHPPAPVPPRARVSHDDLMLLDFTQHTKQSTPTATPTGACVSHTPPARATDEYVDMSPRNAGYVEMKPGELAVTPVPATPATPAPLTPVADGYVEMTYGKSRPIAIAATRAPPPQPVAVSPEDRFRRMLESRGSHGSQIFEFSGSLESPVGAPPASTVPTPAEEERWHHLDTVREAAEDRDRPTSLLHRESRGVDVPPSPGPVPLVACTERTVSCSPSYVTLKPGDTELVAPPRPRSDTDNKVGDWNCGAPAVVLASACGGAAARFTLAGAGAGGTPSAAPPSPSFPCVPLNYAALDLEPRPKHQALSARTYTQIDFARSEKLHAADAT